MAYQVRACCFICFWGSNFDDRLFGRLSKACRWYEAVDLGIEDKMAEQTGHMCTCSTWCSCRCPLWTRSGAKKGQDTNKPHAKASQSVIDKEPTNFRRFSVEIRDFCLASSSTRTILKATFLRCIAFTLVFHWCHWNPLNAILFWCIAFLGYRYIWYMMYVKIWYGIR